MKISELIELLDESGNEALLLRGEDEDRLVLVAPTLMGRVMCAGLNGVGGDVGAYINKERIRGGFSRDGRAGDWNNFGGAERLWFGPDGGPYATFFEPGEPQTLDKMYIQPALNDARYRRAEADAKSATAAGVVHLKNYQGIEFELAVERRITLLEHSPSWLDADSLRCVGFETRTTLRNAGAEPIDRQTGPVTMWTVGQFDCAPSTAIAIPIRPGTEGELGERVCREYFKHVVPPGQDPERRLAVHEDVVLLDGSARGQLKVDIWKPRALGRLGAVDLERNWMTIVEFELHPERDYAATYWLPYSGDPYEGSPISVMVVAGDGQDPTFDPFYELECFSPALFLQPGESFCHVSRTWRLEGEGDALNGICERRLHAPRAKIVELLERSA